MELDGALEDLEDLAPREKLAALEQLAEEHGNEVLGEIIELVRMDVERDERQEQEGSRIDSELGLQDQLTEKRGIERVVQKETPFSEKPQKVYEVQTAQDVYQDNISYETTSATIPIEEAEEQNYTFRKHVWE